MFLITIVLDKSQLKYIANPLNQNKTLSTGHGKDEILEKNNDKNGI